MAHSPKGQILLLAALVLLCRLTLAWSPLSLLPGWQVSVELASLDTTIGTVRIRTAVSEIGQVRLTGPAR
ncbi:hypothetical protein ACFSC3_05525 [Sphingomonas floccifaciens]|uniref:Uncharacterized protein n=1 Tax=Sphingomonas floccifaciens TaxID=1844115 RepID=A0ABW4NAL9_9SPHN